MVASSLWAIPTKQVWAQGREIAVLTQPEGEVSVRKRGRTTRIRETILLDAGDKVVTKANGGGVIYQAYAPVIRMSGVGDPVQRALGHMAGDAVIRRRRGAPLLRRCGTRLGCMTVLAPAAIESGCGRRGGLPVWIMAGDTSKTPGA